MFMDLTSGESCAAAERYHGQHSRRDRLWGWTRDDRGDYRARLGLDVLSFSPETSTN